MFMAYLVGSIPVGYLIAMFFGKIDIREHGSGNIGMTNVFRILGPGPGLLTLVLDVLKGYLVVEIALITLPKQQIGDYFLWGAIISSIGLLVVIGHSYPVWLRFKGGKSVATSLGVLGALISWWVLIPFFVFLLTIVISRYVSLGSILSAISVPITFIALLHSDFQVLPYKGHPSDAAFTGFSIIMAVLVILRHTSNIKRLIAGTENCIGSGKKKKPKITQIPVVGNAPKMEPPSSEHDKTSDITENQ